MKERRQKVSFSYFFFLFSFFFFLFSFFFFLFSFFFFLSLSTQMHFPITSVRLLTHEKCPRQTLIFKIVIPLYYGKTGANISVRYVAHPLHDKTIPLNQPIISEVHIHFLCTKNVHACLSAASSLLVAKSLGAQTPKPNLYTKTFNQPILKHVNIIL